MDGGDGCTINVCTTTESHTFKNRKMADFM